MRNSTSVVHKQTCLHKRREKNFGVWIKKKGGLGAMVETLHLRPGGRGFELASLQNLKRILRWWSCLGIPFSRTHLVWELSALDTPLLWIKEKHQDTSKQFISISPYFWNVSLIKLSSSRLPVGIFLTKVLVAVLFQNYQNHFSFQML